MEKLENAGKGGGAGAGAKPLPKPAAPQQPAGYKAGCGASGRSSCFRSSGPLPVPDSGLSAAWGEVIAEHHRQSPMRDHDSHRDTPSEIRATVFLFMPITSSRSRA